MFSAEGGTSDSVVQAILEEAQRAKQVINTRTAGPEPPQVEEKKVSKPAKKKGKTTAATEEDNATSASQSTDKRNRAANKKGDKNK